jgi:predicted CoA-binding protein
MKMWKTLIIGASTNPERYAYRAAQRLKANGHSIVLLGNKEGFVAGEKIQTEKLPFEDIHTVTLYLNPIRQPDYYNYIISLKPQRVIFNPGTENEQFEALLSEHSIDFIEACTLVLLATGQY